MSSHTPLTTMADLLPYIAPHVSSAPDFLIMFQTRLAVIEFCERTRCWRQIKQCNTSSNGRARITPYGATIHEIEEAYLGQTKLEPTQFTDTDPDDLTGLTTSGPAKYITQINPGEVMVFPKEQGALRISCFLKPVQGVSIGGNVADPLEDANNVLPEFMVAQYAEKLAHGAMYRIMSIPKQDFTDLQMAAVHKAAFEDACNGNFNSNVRGQQRAPLRVKARFI